MAETYPEEATFVLALKVDGLALRRYQFVSDDLPITATKNETLGSTGVSRRNFRQVSNAVDLTWWTAVQKASPSSTDLRAAYRGIQECLRKSNFSIISAIFRAADVPTLSSEALIALLRYSFGGKRQITEWASFMARVSSEFDRRGVDRARLLSGLA